MNNIMSGWCDWYQRLSEDAKLSEIVQKRAEDMSSLTDLERFRFTALLTGNFRAWHNAWHQWRLGVYDAESWESQMRTIMGFLSMPGARAVWGERKFILPEAFQSYVEAEIAGKGASDSYRWVSSNTNNPPNKAVVSDA
jgi:hypothetical protein